MCQHRSSLCVAISLGFFGLLIAKVALPNAEYIIVNDCVNSLLARLLHLFALFVSLVEHV